MVYFVAVRFSGRVALLAASRTILAALFAGQRQVASEMKTPIVTAAAKATNGKIPPSVVWPAAMLHAPMKTTSIHAPVTSGESCLGDDDGELDIALIKRALFIVVPVHDGRGGTVLRHGEARQMRTRKRLSIAAADAEQKATFALRAFAA